MTQVGDREVRPPPPRAASELPPAQRPWWSRIWDRLPARRFQFLLDLSILSGALLFSYLLRFDFRIPPAVRSDIFLVQLPLVCAIQVLALSKAGVYSFIWRYISLRDLHAFVGATLMSAVPLLVLRIGLPPTLHAWRVPLSVIIMDALLAFGGLLGLRLLRRVLYERYEKRNVVGGEARRPKRTLLIGAGKAGFLASDEVRGRAGSELAVVGFVDDDPTKAGAVINGLRVLGVTDDLPRLVREHRIEQVVITIARPSREAMDRIVRTCESIPVKVRIMPGLFEILGGEVQLSRIRDVQIEDLLGRAPVELEVDSIRAAIAGKVVMVTGAGGSIGSELVRQVARFAPSRILLVERSEPALFHIDRELRQRAPGASIESLLADVGDVPRMRTIFERYRPSVVLHAAAHKHVPLMEANPFETVKNNVFGTRALGELAGEHRVEVFVLISTDKAVNPTSMMGVSKRVAELVVQELDHRFDTRFVSVRFGNVLGSQGSVIPIFREQIAAGGPVTITHPDMKRYFMTIPEASRLVLQAGAMGEGGEIFVLDMGDEVKIVDLAERMITLSGLRPGIDVDIVFTGLRPGEKLFEELATEGEAVTKTRHPKIFIGRIERCDDAVLRRALRELAELGERGDEPGLRLRLARLVPEATLSGVPKAVPSEAETPSRPRLPSSTSGEFLRPAPG